MSETVSISKGGSLRYNADKPAMSHLDHRFLLGMAEVMTKSAKRYSKHNWTKAQDVSTAYDSCMRHIFEFMSGEELDGDTRSHHLFHAACNLMIMWHSEQHYPKADDRYFIKEDENEESKEN